ncbi:MAG TPA: hypothetical protein VFA70_05770 [Dehalococcoidia bacterium]|nr:hypothetical protein [Dehalococcoidia bacterium]
MSAAPVSIATGATYGSAGAATFAVTTTAAVTAGDAIIVCGMFYVNTGTLISVIDSAGDTFTIISIINTTAYFIAYCLASVGMASGGSVTANISAATTSTWAGLSVLKVPAGLAGFDKSATQYITTATTTPSVGPTAATSQAVELVVAFFGDYLSAAQSYTAGTGYTAIGGVGANSGGVYLNLDPEYAITASSGTQTGTITYSTSASTIGGVIATFTYPVVDPYPIGNWQEFPHSRAGHAAALRMHHREARTWKRRLSGLYVP